MTGRQDIFQKAMNQGHSAAWDQMWEKAAEAYQQALSEFPDHPQALIDLGLALVQLQRYDEALQAYQKAVRVAPEDPVPLEKVAQLSERLGNLKQAVQAYWQAAEMYIKTQDSNKAIENWLRVTQLDPDHLGAHSRLAIVNEKLAHLPQAVSGYIAVASLLQRGGNLEKAAEMVRRALRLMPNSAEAKQAQALLKSGSLLPKPVRPKGGTGPLLMAHVREAATPKTAESGLDPVAEARKKAITRLAEILFEFSDEGGEGQSVSGRRGMQAIVKGTGPLSLQTGEKTKILLHLSQAIEAQTNGQDDQAAEEMERALEAGFKDSALYYDLGLLHANGQRLESGLRYLQHSVKHADYALGARLTMGRIYHLMNRLSEAVAEYMEALKFADSAVVPPEKANEIRQLYEPLIETLSQESNAETQTKLCDTIHELLMRPDWRAQVAKVREQLPKTTEGAPLLPLAEILTQAQSSQVIDAIGQINQLAKASHLRSAMELAYDSLKHAPGYLPLHSLIGELLIQEGRTQDAIAKFSVVAQAYSARGEAGQSINLLRRIIQLAPMDLSARTRLVEQLAARGQADEAITEYIELADTYYRLAELDMARKTYTNALRMAQQSSTNRDWSIRILRRMADIDTQHLDWRQALRVYEQIRTLQPEDASTRKDIIDLNLRLNQASQASAELDNFIAYLESAGHRDEAIKFLEGLVNENPDQPILRRSLAEEYRQAERIKDAIAQLDALGEILLDAGDKAGAIQTVEAIIAMNPPNIESFQTVLANLKGEIST